MTLDRTGDEVVEDEHECDDGFEDRDADPPLRPCLICRPKLAPHLLRQKTFGLYEDSARGEHERHQRNEEA
ncbi:hypothetical protein L3Q65_45945 [Amycolatopsis sp. FU40]|uniref:hypothetical protein n=1 Tax=Amycolatopsis sp. FU40 TaxID=2914159 RepID=UPI001F1643E4|nr:hypothetical protein [Amycolatopsis sp. FU40]UKD55117.1 hypothetical protein L3Q65_45945 [Amycolatopsis sp. FU40]